MRLLCLLLFVGVCLAERPKLKDQTSHYITLLSDIGEGCDSNAQHGFGIVDGLVEKCDQYNTAKTNETVAVEYEKYKCEKLRFKASLKGGKCTCLDRWKGPICHEFTGCKDPGYAFMNSKCVKDGCKHDGVMGIGIKQWECTCPIPWDGRQCERLACWRKTNVGFERRFRNSVDKCTCGEHYEGENCDKVKSCMRGDFKDGGCVCPQEWTGEICDKKMKCTKQEDGTLVCCSTGLSASILLLVVAYVFKW